METSQLKLREVTYNFLEPEELKKAGIPAGLISAARIDIQGKHLDNNYELFYINYQEDIELIIADSNNVYFLSRPFVHRRIENILNRKIKKGTNRINLENALNSENIAEFTERCKRYFNNVEIAKMHLWEIEENKLPKEKKSNIYQPQWFV
ncbi:MAG: hypothetical protein U9Q73_00080 [Nanoarchaeota archaeon]|nr:hypothetical protein [Nanoarchaeota archaeon]